MKLYHGSNTPIIEIDLSKSKTNKDFGCGFYLSDTEDQAQQMALFKTSILGGDPIVTHFNLNDGIFEDKAIKTKRFDSYSKDWAEFIVLNRKNSTRVQAHDYDLVIGPIANDKVGPQVRRFEEGDIDIDEFLRRVKFMKGITFQYFFSTQKAIEYLEPLPQNI